MDKYDAIPPEMLERERAIFEQGKALLGKNSGGFLVHLRRAIGNDVETLECVKIAETKQDPREYLGGCLRARGKVVEIDYDEIKRRAEMV